MPEATMQILVDAAIKGAAVLLIATAAIALMHKTSAAKRHLVWVVAVSALLLIPVLSVLLPAWQVLPALHSDEVPRLTMNAFAPAAAAPAAEKPFVAVNSEMPALAAEAMTLEASQPRLSATSLILGAWFMGVLLVLATIAFGVARVWWLARRSRPLPVSMCATTVST
ncbi:MAG TPA: hypothetical protein VGD49_13220, partial [Longimicrobiales bacterium]